MTVMYGADADELDRLAVEFIRAADELDGESVALSGILNRVSWLGDIATRYLDNWTGIQIPKINLSTQFLRDAASQLQAEARDQRSTSGGTVSSAGRGWVPPGFGFRSGWIQDGGQFIQVSEKVRQFLSDLDDGKSAALLLASLGGFGKMMPSWLVGKSDWTAVRMLGTKFQSVLHLGKNAQINGRLGGLTNALRNGHNVTALTLPAKEALSGAGLSALFGGFNVFMNQREHGWSDARTITAEVDGALGTAFSFVPGGSMVYGGTRFAGDFVMGKIDDRFDIHGQAVDNYAERTWGVTSDDLTSAQAEKLNERYSGWSGLVNSNYDAGREALGDIGKAASFVGGIFR